jgi:uncharacterized protein YecA (UPF0149 family)
MDLCHCIVPDLQTIASGNKFCHRCGLFYNADAWKVDPRRINAQKFLYSLYNKQKIKMGDVGRNDPCPCGSGKKFKKCCINKVNKV